MLEGVSNLLEHILFQYFLANESVNFREDLGRFRIFKAFDFFTILSFGGNLITIDLIRRY